MLCFYPWAFIFAKICRMVICSVRGTYNHVVVFFAQERKTTFTLANVPTFSIAKSPICLNFHISLKKYTFLVRWWHVQSAVHVTTGLIWSAELTRSSKLLPNRKFITTASRGKNIEYEYHRVWFAPQTFTFFQNMSDGYMSHQRDI